MRVTGIVVVAVIPPGVSVVMIRFVVYGTDDGATKAGFTDTTRFCGVLRPFKKVAFNHWELLVLMLVIVTGRVLSVLVREIVCVKLAVDCPCA